MSIQPNLIEVGCCYSVENKEGPSKPDQHRRVVGIRGEKLIYESWGSGVGYQGCTLAMQKVGIEKFAADVKAKIDCPLELPDMPELK